MISFRSDSVEEMKKITSSNLIRAEEGRNPTENLHPQILFGVSPSAVYSYHTGSGLQINCCNFHSSQSYPEKLTFLPCITSLYPIFAIGLARFGLISSSFFFFLVNLFFFPHLSRPPFFCPPHFSPAGFLF